MLPVPPPLFHEVSVGICPKSIGFGFACSLVTVSRAANGQLQLQLQYQLCLGEQSAPDDFLCQCKVICFKPVSAQADLKAYMQIFFLRLTVEPEALAWFMVGIGLNM